MLMFHAETTINNYSDFNDDIIKTYIIDNALELQENYYSPELENYITLLSNNDILNDKPKFSDNLENFKKEIFSQEPLIVLNYIFTKNILNRYDINIDNKQIIDISHIFKKLELFGPDFVYSLKNIIEHSNIENKNNRFQRGNQMLELFNILNKDINLSLEELIHINYSYKSNTFDSLDNKYSNKPLNEIPNTVLLNILVFDNLNIKLNDISVQEFKYNLIRYLLEDNENVKNMKIKDISNYSDFQNCIKNIFENNQIYSIDTNKLQSIYNMCDIYFKVNQFNIDFKDVRTKFNDIHNDINVEEITF